MAAAGRARRQPARGRWAVAALFFVNGGIMGVWAPQIPLLLPRHQIGEATLGFLIFGLGIGAVGAMLFADRLISHLGSRRMVVLFGALSAPMLPLIVLAPNLGLLASAMVLMGAVLGCMDVAMNANAVAVERRLGRAIMSSSHGFWSLGGFVGSSLGSYFLARYGAEAQAIGVALIAAVVVAISAAFLIGEPQARPAPGAEKTRAVLFPKIPALYVLGAMALFSMVPEGAVLDWAALYLSKEMGSGLERAGLAFACFAGTMALMRFLGDAVRNRFGAVATLRLSGLVGAAGLMLAAIAPNDLVALAGFALAGLGLANMVPIMLSAAGNLAGLSTGAGIATVAMMGYSGILFAPSTIGIVVEAAGFRLIYGALALLLVLVAALSGRAASADGIKAAAAAVQPPV